MWRGLMTWCVTSALVLVGVRSQQPDAVPDYCTERLALVVNSSSSGTNTSTSDRASLANTLPVNPDGVRKMNLIRAQYGSPALTWNVTFARLCSEVLSEVAASTLRNARQCAYGSITAAYPSASCEGSIGWQQCIDGWLGQSLNVDFRKPVIAPDTSDFLTLVWNTSSRVGCANDTCTDGTWLGLCYFDQGLPPLAPLRGQDL